MQPESWMLAIPFVIGIYFYYRHKRKLQIHFETLSAFLADGATRYEENITNEGPLGATTFLFSSGNEHVRYTCNDMGIAPIETLRVVREGEPVFKFTFFKDELIFFERKDIGDALTQLTEKQKAALHTLLIRFRGYAEKLKA